MLKRKENRKLTFAVFRNFCSENELHSLKDWFSKKFEGPNLKLNTIAEISSLEAISDPLIANLLQRIQSLIDSFQGYGKVQLAKVWCVHTTSSDSDMTKLPYIPHFDKLRFLKVMVYLQDVTVDHGPIHITDYYDQEIETRRRSLPLDYKENQLNYWMPKTDKFLPKPILGKAGDLILFDTSTPHHAGKIYPNRERKVIRFDFEDPNWNAHFTVRSQPNLFRRVIRKIFVSSNQ